MEEGLAQKGSLSSWNSRLSPLAQPFTMAQQGQDTQSHALNPLTESTLTPSTSNHLDYPFGDSLLLKSFSNLIDLEDDQPFVHSDPAYKQSEFGFGASQLRNQSRFLGSLAIDDSGLVGSALTPKPSLSAHPHPSPKVVGSSSHLESLLNQDSRLTFSEATVALNMPNKAPIFGPSITNSKPLPKGPYPTGNPFACSNDSSFGGNLSLKSNGKGVIQEEISVVKSISVKGSDRIKVKKSEHKACPENALYGLASKNSGSTARISTPNSVQSLNENEDDLDSPCWKGIQNSGSSFGRISEPVSTLRNQSEVGPSLNPEAPQFIPSNTKVVSNYSSSNFVGHGLTSFGENDSPSFNPPRQDRRLVDSLIVEPTGCRRSSRVYESVKDSTLLENTKISSDDRISPGHGRGRLTKGIKDALHNIEAKFPVAENVPSFSCSGAESLDEYSDMLQYLSHSLSSSPNVNVSTMVKAIHYLSESLIQNYTPDFGSLNSDDHDMIHEIINNLCVPIKHMVNGKTPSHGVPHTGSLDYRANSTSILKTTNTDFELTRSKDLVVSRKLDSQSNHRWGQSHPHMPSTNIQDHVSSSLVIASGIGNGVVPVHRTALKEIRQVDEQFHPQALLSLWIEAQAALCSMKYENHILRMKLQMDG